MILGYVTKSIVRSRFNGDNLTFFSINKFPERKRIFVRREGGGGGGGLALSPYFSFHKEALVDAARVQASSLDWVPWDFGGAPRPESRGHASARSRVRVHPRSRIGISGKTGTGLTLTGQYFLCSRSGRARQNSVYGAYTPAKWPAWPSGNDARANREL